MKRASILLGMVSCAVMAPVAGWAENQITMGPGFQKGQVSSKQLLYDVPPGWRLDPGAASQAGLYAVVLPEGRTLANTTLVITVAFQRKDPAVAGLETLQNFYRVDMQNLMKQFPAAQGRRWQPSGLDPAQVNFMSIELFGQAPGKPSPHHLLMLDAGDGYFSVTLTAETVEALREPPYEAFFNSIRLQ